MSETAREVELALDHRCRLAVVLGILLMVVFMTAHASAIELEYAPQTKPAPLKGLESSLAGNDTIDWSYLRLSSVMKGPFEFDWTSLEKQLDKSASAGKHLILRPIIDWPSLYPALPFYLTNIPGATFKHTNNNHRLYGTGITVPVYTNDATRTAIFNFIWAFGAKYDGDPRIGFIETGLLGAWGELYFARNPYFPLTDVPEDLEGEVLKAYTENIKKTKLMTRWPKQQHLVYQTGYHDDWFADWRIPDNLFRNQTKAGPAALQIWQTQPIGARLHPHFTFPSEFETPPSAATSEAFLKFIQRDHISWLRYSKDKKYLPAELLTNLETLAPKMGYELYVSHADWKKNLSQHTLELSVTITNTGVAPFYYPWKFEAALWKNDQIQNRWPVTWDISQVIPGKDAVTFRTVLPDFPEERENTRLLLRVMNPLKTGFPLRFANKMQDADLNGWLTLGKLKH
ncbi:MAG TPA: DUF4832 domain-containing protein [Verrucomicrobiae bacterium]